MQSILPSRTLRLAGGIVALLGLALATPLVMAQSASGRTVTIVVPFPAGAGPDLAARTIAEKLALRIGQPVIVDNKPGVGGLSGASFVARAPADGNTLLLAPNTLVISPHVLPRGAGGGLDVLKDLAPIVTVATTPMLLAANPQAGIQNTEQLLAAIRKQPELAYGSAGNGSPMHFAGVMLGSAAGAKLLHVPYRGVAPSVVAAMGGEVPLLFVALGGVTGQLKAGKLVPVAVAEKSRSKLLPNVPTLAEGGVRGVEVNAWYGLFAPAGTPPAVMVQLNQDVNEVLRLPDVRERMGAAGLEVVGGKAQVLSEFAKVDFERYGAIARELGIKAD